MVARLLKLRLALLLSAFRGRFSGVFRRILFGLVAAAGAVALAWLPGFVGGPVLKASRMVGGAPTASVERASVDILLVSVLLILALLVPLFVNTGHLEPRQFSHLPARPSAIATALLVTTPVSWPVLWLIVWLGAFVFFRADAGEHGWAIAAMTLLTLFLAICGARVVSALAKFVVRRRSVGALRLTGLILLLAALPVAVFAATQMFGNPGGTATRDAAEILGWTPFGAPVAGLVLALDGDTSGALVRFGVVLAAILILIAVWYPLVRYSIEHIERPAEAAVARDGLGWFERVSARPGPVVGARALSYWVRDPRYRVALAAAPIAPVVMLIALWIAGLRLETLALVPLPVVLLLLGWSLHNDVAMDSTAIWMHVASGTRGRQDRLGRLFPVLLIGVPLVLVGSSITVTVMGDWRALPAVLGLNIGVLLVACGVSSVFSALMPYPATRPGDSPFAQPVIVGAGSGAAQTLSMLCAVALSIPAVWVAGSAIVEMDFGANVFALLFGVGYGLVILGLGILLGGRIFDRVGPELVAITQTFD